MNICLLTIGIQGGDTNNFQNLIFKFVNSSFENETLHKYENRTFYIENGSDKGTYIQKTFGPFQANKIKKSDLKRIIDDSKVKLKLDSILPKLKEIKPNYQNFFKMDLVKSKELIDIFLNTTEKYQLVSNTSNKIEVCSFDLNVYSCFFGKQIGDMFQILTFDDY